MMYSKRMATEQWYSRFSIRRTCILTIVVALSILIVVHQTYHFTYEVIDIKGTENQQQWPPLDRMDMVMHHPLITKYPLLSNDEIVRRSPIIIAEPKDGCPWPEGVIAIKVRRTDFTHRDRLRKNFELLHIDNYLFILGIAVDDEFPTVQVSIMEELHKHNDIVIGNFVDNYKHIRTKEWFKLWYFIERCEGQTFWTMDDDIILDFAEIGDVQDVVCFGYFYPRSLPVRNGSKWHITYEEYDLDRFPPYCDGKGYGISRDAAEAMVAVGTRRDIPWGGGTCGDVFVTGVLRVLSQTHISNIKAIRTFGNLRTRFEEGLEQYGKLIQEFDKFNKGIWAAKPTDTNILYTQDDMRSVVWAMRTRDWAKELKRRYR